jgi:hypothetical protein
MAQFRLVLLDYAKEQLDNLDVQKTINDLIFTKQKNFLRTDPNYIVMDKHDMIGSHALIYETSNLFNPKLIFALRTTYDCRAAKYNVLPPLTSLKTAFTPELAEHFEAFKKDKGLLADCNSWFVDPEFSLKQSGMRLSDIGYTMMYLQVVRMGYDHIVGCTNEKYKAHRWLLNIGDFKKDFIFNHPVVADPHMLILIEKFNLSYLQEIYFKHQILFDDMLDLSIFSNEGLSLKKIIDKNFIANESTPNFSKVS